MTPRRTAIERILREHYDHRKVADSLHRQMTSPFGPQSFRWLTDEGVEELARALGREHRRAARCARKDREHNARLREREYAHG